MSLLVTSLVAMTKYLTGSSLRMEGSVFGLQFEGIHSIMAGTARQAEKEVAGHIVCEIKK